MSTNTEFTNLTLLPASISAFAALIAVFAKPILAFFNNIWFWRTPLGMHFYNKNRDAIPNDNIITITPIISITNNLYKKNFILYGIKIYSPQNVVPIEQGDLQNALHINENQAKIIISELEKYTFNKKIENEITLLYINQNTNISLTDTKYENDIKKLVRKKQTNCNHWEITNNKGEPLNFPLIIPPKETILFRQCSPNNENDYGFQLNLKKICEKNELEVLLSFQEESWKYKIKNYQINQHLKKPIKTND